MSSPAYVAETVCVPAVSPESGRTAAPELSPTVVGVPSTVISTSPVASEGATVAVIVAAPG